MARYGLQVNFAARKTEAIVCFAGRGLVGAKEQIWGAAAMCVAAGSVPTLTLPGGQVLRIVSRYKHLGIIAAASRSFEAEVTVRLASGRAAAVALGQKVYGSRFPEDSTEAHMAAATVGSRVLHGAGAWPALTTKQYRRVEAVLLQPLRRAATCGRPAGMPAAHISNAVLRGRFSVAPPQARLDIARLR